jgi:integrase
LAEREKRLRKNRASGNAWRRARHQIELPDLSSVAFADYLQPIVLLSLNTGLRRGEILQLKWADVDLRQRELIVRGDNAKSGKTRHIPLNNEALTTLQQWRSDSRSTGWVFAGNNGKCMQAVKSSWNRALRRAGIDDFRWHDLRHNFASRLVMSGVDLNTVRELLGHADLTMTLRYAHLSPEHKADAVARLCEPDDQENSALLDIVANR